MIVVIILIIINKSGQRFLCFFSYLINSFNCNWTLSLLLLLLLLFVCLLTPVIHSLTPKEKGLSPCSHHNPQNSNKLTVQGNSSSSLSSPIHNQWRRCRWREREKGEQIKDDRLQRFFQQGQTYFTTKVSGYQLREGAKGEERRILIDHPLTYCISMPYFFSMGSGRKGELHGKPLAIIADRLDRITNSLSPCVQSNVSLGADPHYYYYYLTGHDHNINNNL